MCTDPVTITYVADYRLSDWLPYIPSRPGWLVTCSEHEGLGKDSEGRAWGYAERARAQRVATRHRRAYHDDQPS